MTESDLQVLVRRALDEDIGTGDITTQAIVPADARACGTLVQKQAGVTFGYKVAETVFTELDPGVSWRELEPEGRWRESRVDLAEVKGKARALLTGERVALNFLQHLSGVATLTEQFVRELEGTGVEVLDTRKTTPGLRQLEKEAVRAGGGTNHRMGLYDAVLIKDNHIEIAGGVPEAIAVAKKGAPDGVLVEVECETLTQVEEALNAGIERILLDNMSAEEIHEAVKLTADRAELEVSGGITLKNVGEIAATKVKYISVGALTHSAPALDLSLEIKII